MRAPWLALALPAAALGQATAPPAQTRTEPAGQAGIAGQAPIIITRAVDPTRLAAARHLLHTMNVDATLDRMGLVMAPLFAQGVIGYMAGNAASQAMLNTLLTKGAGGRDRLIAILSQEFFTAFRRQYPALEDASAREYAALFDVDELRAIDAFYSTGVGAKTIRLMPEIQRQVSAAADRLGRVAGEEASRHAFERAMREMLPAAAKPGA